MLLELINDMNKALDNDCYLAALAIALMLPDICAKAKYPEEKSNRKRYIDWYDEYIGQYQKCPNDDKSPYLSGEVVYSLRCSFLHQGTPNINKEEITEECCKIENFRLIKQKKNRYNQYPDLIAIDIPKDDSDLIKVKSDYDVNIRGLCQKMEWCAKSYYNKNKDKFDFFNYSIVEYEELNKFD